MYPIAKNLDVILPILIAIGATVAAWKVGMVVQNIAAVFQTASLQVSLYAASVGGAITADALQTAGLTAKEIIVGVLTGKIALATAAQWAWNAATTAFPFALAIAGFAAIVGGVVALAKAFGDTNPAITQAREAMENTKTAATNLKDAIDKAKNNYDGMKEAAEANANAIKRETDSVFAAIEAYKKGNISVSELESKIKMLSDAAGGMEIVFDEATGTLSVTRDELNNLADAARNAQDVEILKNDYYELVDALSVADKQLIANSQAIADIKEQYANGSLTVGEYNNSLRKLKEEHRELTDDVVNGRAAVESARTAYEEATAASLDFTSSIELQRTEIEAWASEWGLSTDAIIADMERQGITFDQYKANFEDLQASVEERTDNITNSFKKIPTEFDMSAQEMLENLQANKETYAKWEANMEEITRLLGPTAAAEFGKLGPEANSAMEEILQSPELLEQYRETRGVKIDEATGTAIENWNDPNFIGASSDALTEGAVQVQANTALPDAVAEKVGESAEAASAAVEAADFSSIGTTINDAMVTSVTKMGPQAKTAMIKAMQGIAQAITSSGPSVQSAVLTITRNMIKTLETYKTDSTRSIKAAMTAFVSAISGTRSSAASAAGSVTKGAISAIDSQKSSAYSAGYNVGSYTGNGMLAGLATREPSIISKARSIANKVTSTMKNALSIHSPSKEAEWIFEMFLLGGVEGLENEEGKLYRTIDDIADETLERMARISDAMDETFNRKMQVAIDSQQTKASAIAQVSDRNVSSSQGANGQVINNYNLNSTYNSPASMSWRDIKLYQETQSQQLALLGG